jgi:small subunit ribosomal protein S1
VIDDLYPDAVVEGAITNVVSYGAFVDLGEGVEGLVHLSQIPGGETVHSYLKPGSPVTVRVLEIDDGQHQISLRLENASGSL